MICVSNIKIFELEKQAVSCVIFQKLPNSDRDFHKLINYHIYTYMDSFPVTSLPAVTWTSKIIPRITAKQEISAEHPIKYIE